MSPSIIVIFIILTALILFITEIIPLPAAAMAMTVSFYLLGFIDSDTVLKPFASGTVMIIASMAVIGQAVFETGGADQVGRLLTGIAKKERSLILILVILSGLVSGFISNTGAAALLLTFTLGICRTTGMNRAKLMYPVVVGCSFGGGITIVGTTSGPFLKETLDGLNIGETFSFFEFAPLSLLLLIMTAIYMYTIGYNLLPERPENEGRFQNIGEKRDFSKVPAWKRRLSLITLAATFVAMILEKQIEIPMHFAAITGALIVCSFKCTTAENALNSIPLGSIIIYASMVPLSDVLTNSGAAEVIADLSMEVLETTKNPVVILIFIFLIITTITNFMSNAATIILFTPIAIIVAQTLGMDIKGILVAVRFAGSLCFATPMATPANSMAIEPGGYRFRDFMTVGLPLTFLSVVICIVYISIMYPLL